MPPTSTIALQNSGVSRQPHRVERCLVVLPQLGLAQVDQPPVIKKILPRLGLAMEVLTEPEDPVWLPKKSTLRGPPDGLFPPDPDEAGLPVELDAVEEDPGEPLFDELPVDDCPA